MTTGSSDKIVILNVVATLHNLIGESTTPSRLQQFRSKHFMVTNIGLYLGPTIASREYQSLCLTVQNRAYLVAEVSYR